MQTFQFDLSEKNDAYILNVKQGDVGRKFKAVICDGGMPYSIPAGVQFSVWFSGPGGEGNYSAIGEESAFGAEGNSVTVELVAQMMTKAGTGAMCLVMNGADGAQLGLWNVVYVVEAVPGMESEAAAVYYTALSELAAQAIRAAETFKTDTLLTVEGKAADGSAVGAALAGKAPAGYGLGGACQQIDSLNNAKETGFYLSGGGCPDGGWWMCTTLKMNDNYIIQNAFARNGSLTCNTRRVYTGTWGEWEWVNPHMQLGVEYRTTERWQGKVVYAKLIECGALPNNSYRETSPFSDAAYNVVSIEAIATNGGVTYSFPVVSNTGVRARVAVVGNKLEFNTTEDMSAYSAKAKIKYTKD